MALLKLSDIGKIYVSEGNVAVGIRGVSLSFERGEFVAVTGQSGSGKSTLLNVISGMDTYEEGELYIEGQATSHYMQSDWEEYRKKYISFIFQDYNIIDSFTVLENVELALMHIEDKKQRRERALELLRRVGMTSHIKHKGSRLSGGQKQRTVIARALAKDSPIILADEPTGNLDSVTSAQIIELLREISKDKLVIVVTHNFDDFEACATRHIRIFDGAVESDQAISAPQVSETHQKTQGSEPISKKQQKRKDIKNGFTLGKSIFTSRPRLSAFLCLLMVVGTLGVFFVTSLCGEATAMFDKNYMFTPKEGRVILVRRDGKVISDGELEKIKSEQGVKDILKCDKLLDTRTQGATVVVGDGSDGYIPFDFSYDEDFGKGVIGSYPQAPDEVFMYVPISYTEHFGKDAESFGEVYISGLKLKVVGVKYYIDNNLTPKCSLTREGFDLLTAAYYLGSYSSAITVNVSAGGSTLWQFEQYSFMPSYEVEKGKVYIDNVQYNKYSEAENAKITMDFSAQFHSNVYYGNVDGARVSFSRRFTNADITKSGPADMMSQGLWGNNMRHQIAISPYLLRDMADEVLSQSYGQVSLLFEDNKSAEAAIAALNGDTYMAVSSYETYTPDAEEALLKVLTCMLLLAVWVLAIVFLAFFIHLCSSRTLGAFKGDMAIMRSMGIPVRSIRVGMFVRMLIALIPAYIAVIATAVLIFTLPAVNAFFTYLYAWQYAAIFIGMLLLTVRVTQKQIKKLFGQSVKKALRGGAAND